MMKKEKARSFLAITWQRKLSTLGPSHNGSVTPYPMNASFAEIIDPLPNLIRMRAKTSMTTRS
jgi:hypothetical protein